MRTTHFNSNLTGISHIALAASAILMVHHGFQDGGSDLYLSPPDSDNGGGSADANELDKDKLNKDDINGTGADQGFTGPMTGAARSTNVAGMTDDEIAGMRQGQMSQAELDTLEANSDNAGAAGDTHGGDPGPEPMTADNGDQHLGSTAD